MRYIIQDLTTQGYWSDYHNSFKGIMFATEYKSKVEAENSIPKIKERSIFYPNPDVQLTIIQIY